MGAGGNFLTFFLEFIEVIAIVAFWNNLAFVGGFLEIGPNKAYRKGFTGERCSVEEIIVGTFRDLHTFNFSLVKVLILTTNWISHTSLLTCIEILFL